MADRLDPDRGALKPPRMIQLIVRIPRRVAFRTLGYFLDEVTPPDGRSFARVCLGSLLTPATLCSANNDGRSSSEKKHKRTSRQETCSHYALSSVAKLPTTRIIFRLDSGRLVSSRD